jgi:GNAT superfamily N-acetyltransferase
LIPSLREATDADTRLVHSSFHTAFWKTHAHKHTLKEVYDSGMDKRIDRLLFRSRVLVAYFPEVPDEVLGWSCLEGSALHYVYVKGVYRRRGIGKGLVPDSAKWYTHPTDREGRVFAESLSLKFNPFLLEKS